MHRKAHTGHYHPKRPVPTFQHKMDQIIMQINPRVNLWLFAAGEGPVTSWINARGISTDFFQEQDCDPWSFGDGGEKNPKCQDPTGWIKYMTDCTGRTAKQCQDLWQGEALFQKSNAVLSALATSNPWSKADKMNFEAPSHEVMLLTPWLLLSKAWKMSLSVHCRIAH